MDFYDILFAKKLGGGGGSSVDVESLSVTENGTYEEEGKAYSPVNVNVNGEFITVYKGTSVPDSTVGKDGDIFVEY